MPLVPLRAQIARIVANTAGLSKVIEHKGEKALYIAGADIVKYAKLHAPYTDRTTNLRRSVTYAVLKAGESIGAVYETSTEGDQSVQITNTEKDTALVIYAGMKYGIWVEFKKGYWVIKGAIEHFRPLITEILGKNVKFIHSDFNVARDSAREAGR